VSAPVEQLSCQELVELVTDYLEGALGDEERVRFDEHLVICEGCRVYLGQMEATIGITGRLRPEDLSPEAERALLGAFRRWKAP
jgi:predicted anti-sigma-YlaC factor YlaD